MSKAILVMTARMATLVRQCTQCKNVDHMWNMTRNVKSTLRNANANCKISKSKAKHAARRLGREGCLRPVTPVVVTGRLNV